MSESIPLRRPGAEVGARHDTHAVFGLEPFDLYGRHHEVSEAEADVGVTRLSEGLYLDLRVRMVVRTSCDRTLEPTELRIGFGESEFLPGPNNKELSVENWTLDLVGYAQQGVLSEVPIFLLNESSVVTMAFALVPSVKNPVDSITTSAPISPHGRAAGSFSA